MCFSVNNNNVIALKYTYLRPSAVQVSKSELPKDGQAGTKHVATDGDFNVTLNQGETVIIFKLH
jgi:hypothetical protein